ncbi:MAG TPA: metalloregulator ArsR/SmtB family transcription factor [Anaerolineales bacterium]|nr:metalloregulator ArsR/SmtB family transcription factor [Anaerolineales bacterium]
MPPIPVVLEKTATKNIKVSLSPTHNIFSSMLLLVKGDQPPGIHGWINKTRAAMSKKELADHELAVIGFYFATLPEDGEITFPAYLNQLENTDAIALRDKMLNTYANLWQESTPDVNWDEVLASADNYVEFLRSRFDDEHVDEKLEKRAYDYVIDPPAMKDFLVGHMTWIWKTHFESEWRRVESMLMDSVRSFSGTDLTSMSRTEAASYVTGQDVSDTKWCKKMETMENVVFIPNPHIGPYVHASGYNNTLLVHFGARQPDETQERIPDLDRNEIVARLSALADDTRLHILQLVAEKGEIRVQDILEVVNLSQPSVSRYLSQLTASGYLQERREGGAKVYSLNKDRIDKTLKAVKTFLLGRF